VLLFLAATGTVLKLDQVFRVPSGAGSDGDLKYSQWSPLPLSSVIPPVPRNL